MGMTARLPIRWRLTLWYAALLTAALLVFGVALYAGLRYFLLDAFQEQLRGQATLAMSTIQIDGGTLALDANIAASLRNDEHFARLITADGRVVVDTSDLIGPINFDHRLVDNALAGQRTESTVRAPHDVFGVVTEPVRSGETVVGVLQIGLSRGDIDDILRILPIAFGIAAPLVLLVAGGGGYLLSGRALTPVAAITTLASRLGAKELHTRLNLTLPDDELGRLARTFDSMLSRIEDAFERQRRFTGDAAHELRTPLSLMRSQVDLALMRPRSAAEYRDALQGLEGDIQRLTTLVGTLLTLARADANSLPLTVAAVDLGETISSVLDQYGPRAAEAGISLRQEAMPATLEGDEDLLIQVLVNLVDNALAHTQPGDTILVGCRSEDRRIRLWVVDTGSGIAPAHLPRIFDRFYRPDSGRTREHGGTGLGLAICKAIAEAHGGTIGLSSRLGAGTHVELILPSKQDRT